MWILPRSWMVSLPLCHHIFDDFIFWRWHQFDENHMRQAENQFRMDLFLTKGFELNTFRRFLFSETGFSVLRDSSLFFLRDQAAKKNLTGISFTLSLRITGNTRRHFGWFLATNLGSWKPPTSGVESHQPRELKATNLGSWKPPTSGVESHPPRELKATHLRSWSLISEVCLEWRHIQDGISCQPRESFWEDLLSFLLNLLGI